MQWRFKRNKPHILDAPIDRVLTEMVTTHPETKEYKALVERLNQLMKMKQKTKRRRPSPDTVLLVVGNLLGIGVIVAYEERHVLASKGLGFILKPR